MAVGSTRVVQITNIAPQATKDQMQTLFGYLGKIDDIRLYPTIRDVSCPVQSRICYVKFVDATTVGVAQHMTNTVFIDRALIVIPIVGGEIPDEYKALEMSNNGTIVPGLYPSEPKLPPNVVNTIEGVAPNQIIQTRDPQLEVLGLPLYPPLPATYDLRKVEEIRRSILVINVDPTWTSQKIIDFFTVAGEVKYIRFCVRDSDKSSCVIVEFSEQPSILSALQLNGKLLDGKPVMIHHSTQAIVKPQAKSNEAAQREIEEAMSRVKEAQSLISAAIDPVIGMLSKDKRSSRRTRSRSRDRHRRSRSRSRRSRSRHRGHSRSRRSTSRSKRSRSRDRRRRSKSRSRKRTRSRSRSRRSSRRSRSRSKSRSKTSRSRGDRDKDRRSKEKDLVEKERKTPDDKSDRENGVELEERKPTKDKKSRRSRSPSRTKHRSRSRDRERDRRRSRSRDRRRSRSRDRKRSRDRDRKRSRSRDRKRSRSRDRKRSRSRGKSRRHSPSPRHSRKRSKSRSRDDKRVPRTKDRHREKALSKERSPSRSKVPRNYDEEEVGYNEDRRGKNRLPPIESGDESSTDSKGDKDSPEKSDNMDISNSP
ncbi:probable splicing factor, arginine/serine-rich 7 [Chrysoperla carnea]|uniref:probable splicing factor, arginine/serine-rich 7 n=1 Tax=Chrysoperla carnea TaxID=189513 RepID=UPI001D064889|nr:probable splicing factor, arginine/serine-rich 7 [Chrysoperla carnea]